MGGSAFGKIASSRTYWIIILLLWLWYNMTFVTIFYSVSVRKEGKAVYSCLLLFTPVCVPVFASPSWRLQRTASFHPPVISDENVFLLSLSLPVLGHNHLSFQAPFSCICWRATLYYPGRLSLLLSGVSVWNRAAGDSHTQKHVFGWKQQWQI